MRKRIANALGPVAPIPFGIEYPDIDKLGGDRRWKAIVKHCKRISFKSDNEKVFSPYLNKPIDYGAF